MTVKELLAALKDKDPEADVYMVADYYWFDIRSVFVDNENVYLSDEWEETE